MKFELLEKDIESGVVLGKERTDPDLDYALAVDEDGQIVLMCSHIRGSKFYFVSNFMVMDKDLKYPCYSNVKLLP